MTVPVTCFSWRHLPVTTFIHVAPSPGRHNIPKLCFRQLMLGPNAHWSSSIYVINKQWVASRGGQKAEFGVREGSCYLRRRSLRSLFVGEAAEEIDFFLIFFAKFKLIIVFKFSWKILWSYFNMHFATQHDWAFLCLKVCFCIYHVLQCMQSIYYLDI